MKELKKVSGTFSGLHRGMEPRPKKAPDAFFILPGTRIFARSEALPADSA
jgi:hypothetical protein